MKESSKKTKPIFVVAAILILLALQEILFRVVFPFPQVLNFNRINYSHTVVTPELRNLKKLSNASFTWASDPDNAEFTHNLNLYGFRDRNWNLGKSRSERVLFVGDSFVEGFMAKKEDAIPQAFEKAALGDGTKLRAINLGVGANAFGDYMSLIRDSLVVFRPEHLIIVIYTNDLPPVKANGSYLHGGFRAEYSKWYLPRLFYIISAAANKEVVARRWNAKPFPFLPAAPDQANPFSLASNAKAFNTFISKKVGQAMRRGRFNYYAYDQFNEYRTNLLKDFDITPLLKDIKEYALSTSTKLYIAYLPSRLQVTDSYLPYQREFNIIEPSASLTGPEFQRHATLLGNAARSLGIPFLDLTPIFKKEEEKGRRLYWNYDEHMKTEGYGLAAEKIYDWWKAEQ